MPVDKLFCASSYLAFRYIERDGTDFFEGMRHRNTRPVPASKRTPVRTAADIDGALGDIFSRLRGEKLGLLLSGGMDSAILASYMPGRDAYTFRFTGGEFEREELERARAHAERYGLKLHYVDISWSDVTDCLPLLMRRKCAPVHSIEPQIYKAASRAKADGVTMMVTGESADLNFGGMDGLLAKDWTLEEFRDRYTFTKPEDVLKQPADVGYLFERYRRGGGGD